MTVPAPTTAPGTSSAIARTVPLARALVAGGLPAIKVTVRTPVALDAHAVSLPKRCAVRKGRCV